MPRKSEPPAPISDVEVQGELCFVPAGKPSYFSATEIKARGWTDALIRDFLGEPDATRPNPCYRSAAPMRLYLRERVLATEHANVDWKETALRSAGRRKAASRAVETKRERLYAYIKALEVRVPVLSMPEVIERACENYNRFKRRINLERYDGGEDFRPATPRSDAGFLQRIAVNFLRHRLSSYEEELGRLFGKVGTEEAYHRLNQKIYAAICRSYPELAEECARQIKRKRANAPR